MTNSNKDGSDGDNYKSKFDDPNNIQNHIEMVRTKFQKKLSQPNFQITTKKVWTKANKSFDIFPVVILSAHLFACHYVFDQVAVIRREKKNYDFPGSLTKYGVIVQRQDCLHHAQEN